MFLNPETITARDRRTLGDHEQPQTMRQFAALLNNRQEPALICGPISPPRVEGSEGRAFVVRKGFDVLVKVNGAINAILRKGRFDLNTWADASVTFYTAHTSVRSIELKLSVPTQAGRLPNKLDIRLSYRVDKAHLLLRYDRPLAQFCDTILHSLQSVGAGPSEAEVRGQVQQLAPKLRKVGAGEKIGITLEELHLIKWQQGEPPPPTALDQLKQQAAALEQQRLIVSIRQEGGNYYLSIPLIHAQDATKRFVIYLACNDTYPRQAPQVFVSQDGEERPLELAIIAHWRTTNTLADILREAAERLES